MRYQKIHSQIWNDEKFVNLIPAQQRLFLYILTCPHGNIIGLFVLKKGYVCDDLKYLPKDLEKDLRKLIQMGLIEYDFSTSVILVKKFLKHNPITNPNQIKAAIKLIRELPKTELIQVFKEVLPVVLREALSEVLLKPEHSSVSVSVSDSVSDSEEGGAGGNEHQAPEPEPKYTFENFWSDYPRKKAKGDAEKAWAKIKPGEHLAETIRQAVQRAKTSDDWTKDGGQYIPYPATWLNRKGWEDEYMEAGTVGTTSQSSSEDAEIIRLFNEAQRKKKEAMSATQSG